VGYDVISPVNNAYLQGTCDAAPAGWSCDKTMEELRMAWAREGDAVKRKKLTEDIQKRAYDQSPYVNFGQFFWPMAYRANLKGLIVTGIPVMWNVEK
jgi:peptide/nickel transport system substrate-binding protein